MLPKKQVCVWYNWSYRQWELSKMHEVRSSRLLRFCLMSGKIGDGCARPQVHTKVERESRILEDTGEKYWNHHWFHLHVFLGTKDKRDHDQSQWNHTMMDSNSRKDLPISSNSQENDEWSFYFAIRTDTRECATSARCGNKCSLVDIVQAQVLLVFWSTFRRNWDLKSTPTIQEESGTKLRDKARMRTGHKKAFYLEGMQNIP